MFSLFNMFNIPRRIYNVYRDMLNNINNDIKNERPECRECHKSRCCIFLQIWKQGWWKHYILIFMLTVNEEEYEQPKKALFATLNLSKILSSYLPPDLYRDLCLLYNSPFCPLIPHTISYQKISPKKSVSYGESWDLLITYGTIYKFFRCVAFWQFIV